MSIIREYTTYRFYNSICKGLNKLSLVNCAHGQHVRYLYLNPYLKYLDVAIVGVVALALAQGGGGVGVMRPGPDGAEPGREQADLQVRQLDRQVQYSL